MTKLNEELIHKILAKGYGNLSKNDIKQIMNSEPLDERFSYEEHCIFLKVFREESAKKLKEYFDAYLKEIENDGNIMTLNKRLNLPGNLNTNHILSKLSREQLKKLFDEVADVHSYRN